MLLCFNLDHFQVIELALVQIVGWPIERDGEKEEGIVWAQEEECEERMDNYVQLI
jgi:hypothetical protein